MKKNNVEIKKWFVVSDIHGDYTDLKTALDAAGFSRKNNTHAIIILGDIFDRLGEAVKVYNFIHSIPKARRILVRGNHELLFLDLLKKHYPESYDFSNGTVDTFCQIADQYYLTINESCEQIRMSDFLNSDSFYIEEDIYAKKHSLWEDIRNTVANSKITKWLKSKEWKNYYELNNKFIFVHSFIPTTLKQESIDKFGMLAYGFENPEHYEYNPDWRKSNYWDQAVWGNPFEQYRIGLFKKEEDSGRILVCGHWHTSDFYRYLKHIHRYMHECAPIYYSKGLIGLDGGCKYDIFNNKYIHPQNILVIDENMVCYDKYGNKLEEEPYGGKQEANSSKLSYRIDPKTDLNNYIDDISLCCAKCKTACARKQIPTGICTVSDFSNSCSDYKKHD